MIALGPKFEPKILSPNSPYTRILNRCAPQDSKLLGNFETDP